jgi:hypothetical protein
LHPHFWQTLAFKAFVLDLAAVFSEKLNGVNASSKHLSQIRESALSNSSEQWRQRIELIAKSVKYAPENTFSLLL